VADAPTVTEADILKDVIGTNQGDLPPEVARQVLRWKFAGRAVARMNELADRGNRGTITDAEREELEKYLRVGSLINLVQAKAHLSLKPAPSQS
jgi:hypothetical protein